MKTTFRSCLVFIVITAVWPQGPSGLPVFVAAGYCQTTIVSDRIRIGVYPAVFSSPQVPVEVEPQLGADSAFVLWSKRISTLLAAALLNEDLEVLPPETFVDFLQSRPAYDPFHPDSVRILCSAFAVGKLVLPIISTVTDAPSAKVSQPPVRIRLSLHWLDGASGEVTRLHVSEYQVPRDRDTASVLVDAFDARAATEALLGAPELIISQEEELAPLPLPLALPQPAMTNHKSRKLLWYLSAAAVIGGGSAYLFLGRSEAGGDRKLLPEPPGPPPE
ncbi:MAG: hypothetical protein ACREOO_04015 [bacterium]